MIEYCEGNLLDADAEALVNTVNTVGVMGKGIALQFKQRFPLMAKEYEAVCRRHGLQTGKVHLWKNAFFPPRYIINFPTKEHWKRKSKIAFITTGLQDMVSVIQTYHIQSIAVPPLGCGLGGLSWTEVEIEIQKYLAPLNEVKVLLFPPAGFGAAIARWRQKNAVLR
ncbi:MAG: macro domain-containing protein [Planctomycetaceae bacterium]|jgi:O-acetyl-ADP-ribose deacetylase (regulator of RNase III)|nr:macro domain-containing protein [Planctomycetaceae bacterium]